MLSLTLASAQSEEDAYRISLGSPGGTARSNGMANAFGALGVDPVSIAINPAGFGLCRTSAISITPALEVNGSATNYYNTKDAATQSRGYVSNVALILNKPASSGSDWRSGTFGVLYDRRQSYYWSTEATGDHVPGSILDRFVNEAQGTTYLGVVDSFPFTAGLAWNAYGMDTIPGEPASYASYIPQGSTTHQRNAVDASGRNANTAFFYSGNYMDKLYIGLSVGINSHRFERTTTHTETSDDQALDLGQVKYVERLVTSGNGFDVKAGFLVRITERFRAGMAFHSPQWMQLNDAYSTQLNTTFRTPDSNGNYSYEALSPDGTFAYRVNTPWRVVTSAAYLAGTNGSVSVDHEYADMRNMLLRAANSLDDLYDFQYENDRIKDRFQATHTVRVGTEWRAGNMYYRAGWGFITDGYRKNDPLRSGGAKTFAAGIGYRSEHFTVDLGLNYALQTVRILPYGDDLVEPIIEERSSYRTFVTITFAP